jgi:lipoate-protein ligase A
MEKETVTRLDALRDNAIRRKKFLKAVIKNLVQQHGILAAEYDLVKREIQILDDRIEEKISESECCELLDTVRLDTSTLKLVSDE